MFNPSHLAVPLSAALGKADNLDSILRQSQHYVYRHRRAFPSVTLCHTQDGQGGSAREGSSPEDSVSLSPGFI